MQASIYSDELTTYESVYHPTPKVQSRFHGIVSKRPSFPPHFLKHNSRIDYIFPSQEQNTYIYSPVLSAEMDEKLVVFIFQIVRSYTLQSWGTFDYVKKGLSTIGTPDAFVNTTSSSTFTSPNNVLQILIKTMDLKVRKIKLWEDNTNSFLKLMMREENQHNFQKTLEYIYEERSSLDVLTKITLYDLISKFYALKSFKMAPRTVLNLSPNEQNYLMQCASYVFFEEQVDEHATIETELDNKAADSSIEKISHTTGSNEALQLDLTENLSNVIDPNIKFRTQQNFL